MDITDVKTMLNRVYELEGLLELAASRDPGRIPSLAPLICAKCKEVAEIAESWNLGEERKSLDSHPLENNPEKIQTKNYIQSEQSVLPESPIEITEEPAVEVPDNYRPQAPQEAQGFKYADYPFPEEEEKQKMKNHSKKKKILTNESFEQTIDDSTEENPQESLQPSIEEYVKEFEEGGTDSIAPELTTERERLRPEKEEPQKEEKQLAKEELPPLKEEIKTTESPESRKENIMRSSPTPSITAKLFSINDNFRFRREIFRGSADDFSQSLRLVDRMKDYSEAEDYFYSDLQLDAEQEIVAEFMSIIKRRFKS